MTIELIYNEPFSGANETTSVDNAAEVKTFADRILDRYLAVGEQVMPGLELQAGDGQSMSIALAPIGWALIRTDANYDQNCTRNTDQALAGSTDVRWEEPTPIPNSWFIPQPDAMLGITQWIIDRSLAAELHWSNDCA